MPYLFPVWPFKISNWFDLPIFHTKLSCGGAVTWEVVEVGDGELGF